MVLQNHKPEQLGKVTEALPSTHANYILGIRIQQIVFPFLANLQSYVH